MEKYYIVIYKSSEHFEVLNWVKAESKDKAIEKFKKNNVNLIKRYMVKDAVICEWKDPEDISFK